MQREDSPLRPRFRTWTLGRASLASLWLVNARPSCVIHYFFVKAGCEVFTSLGERLLTFDSGFLSPSLMDLAGTSPCLLENLYRERAGMFDIVYRQYSLLRILKAVF